MADEILLDVKLVTDEGTPITSVGFAVPADAHNFMVWPSLGGVPRLTCHADMLEGQTKGDLITTNRTVYVFQVFNSNSDDTEPRWQATGLTHAGEFVWHQHGYAVYIEPVV